MTREEARNLGVKTYESDTPCSICNAVNRYTTSGRCMACAKVNWKLRRERAARAALTNEVVERIVALNNNYKTPMEIADALNYSGFRNKLGNRYNVQNIRQLCETKMIEIKNNTYHKPTESIVILHTPNKANESKFDFTNENEELPSWI